MDWADFRTTPGFAFGAETDTVKFDDSAAVHKRRAGIALVELTENEWRQAANHLDRDWLYTVYQCETATPKLHCIPDPFGDLLTKSCGATVTAVDVLAASEQDEC